ncbi:hypothetical protein GCM10007147_30450 [Nocardiopsis kunsanensis]|uniref:Uncharacterized protein n=1 Tax=Nocardiopsis kunsanensis TaxID=141693 RepID=A0A918XGA0_9ACTN|nr:hypothetical protein GCM10007147_30450 [Nocardiopsis kunsanensis]
MALAAVFGCDDEFAGVGLAPGTFDDADPHDRIPIGQYVEARASCGCAVAHPQERLFRQRGDAVGLQGLFGEIEDAVGEFRGQGVGDVHGAHGPKPTTPDQ